MSKVERLRYASDRFAAVEVAAEDPVLREGVELGLALASSRTGFSVERIPACEARSEWAVADGALQHRSKGFFSVTGVRDEDGERLMLYQPQGAINGMLTRWVDGQRHFLFQARAEPGNVRDAQFGPTLQSTPANYLQYHGGKASDFFPIFLQQTWSAAPRSETTQLDLGARYHHKTKRVIFAEVVDAIESVDSFHWLSPDALRWGVRQDFVMNTDARALLGVCRWSMDPDAGELSPRSPDLRRSLAAPVRPEVVGAVHQQLAGLRRRTAAFVPLEDLRNWTFDEDGLREVRPERNVSVGFYSVSARYREVKRWIQPLLTASGAGHCCLLARERAGEIEFLVPVIEEPGLATGRALGPTWLRYPGDAALPPRWLEPHLADVWGETTESDEGGRFIDHRSRFTVARLSRDAPSPPEGSGTWMRLSELKSFLEASNRCTIQLRVIVSHLLGLP